MFNISELWIYSNFILFVVIFLVCLYVNLNFNTLMVGTIYLLPLIPFALTPENEIRFLIVSVQNLVFGTIEIIIFVLTVKPSDATFDREHIRQLTGHTLPIAVALVGLSYVSRMTTVPVAPMELCLIMTLFVVGSVMRVIAIYQIGRLGFKFDIVFRDKQTIKTNQLYGFMRHPSYTAMMIVILAYALNTHSWMIGGVGMSLAWFGFQFRIHFEEKALLEHFGADYEGYRQRTGMWLPKLIRMKG